jgi:hypothetical protein
MKLPVPYIPQEAGSMDCQVATALMRLRYFGDEITSFEEIRTAMTLPKYNGVRHTHAMITYLRNLGYETFFGFHEGSVTDEALENKTEQDRVLFEEQLNHSVTEYQRTKLELLLAYADAGGHFSTKLPTLDTIDQFLKKRIPVELGVEFQTLHMKPSAKGGAHSILIIGKEEDSYWVHDPMPSTKGTFLVHQDRLLHAWYKMSAYITTIWK